MIRKKFILQYLMYLFIYYLFIYLFIYFLVIPVKLGIIGVMNRSQLDINNKKVGCVQLSSLMLTHNSQNDDMVLESSKLQATCTIQ